MKLVGAMMVGPGETDRYLDLTVPALLELCDEVVIRWEAQPEHDYLDGLDRVALFEAGQEFFGHEGRARQELLEHSLLSDPTHILVVDADELVTDPEALRAACETSGCPVLSLEMREIWRADANGLWSREDGGWRAHPVPVCFRAPEQAVGEWRIQDRALACGREPMAVRSLIRQDCWEPSGAGILHLGWLREAERQARYERYVEHDGGRFHAGAHLQSIMWPDSRVRLTLRGWPDGWAPALRDAIRERAARG